MKVIEPVRDLIIVGGGTAGWMAAAQLSRVFGRRLHITVIESDRIGTIGVGEATFNTIKTFFDSLGLDECEWMPSCGATYKIAIRFVNWRADGRHFYHPFERSPQVDGLALPEWWLRLRANTTPMDYACFTAPHICDTGRAPRFLDGTLFDENAVYHPYAYHFDASRVAAFLCRYAMRHGVERVVQDVVHVGLGVDGSISGIQTEDGVRRSADLYIDCTGFRGLLINEVLGEPFLSFGDSLLCDRAVAGRLVRTRPGHDIKPYTTATALSAGWVWDIPLFESTGTGYVYSSRFLTEEQAEAEFRHHLGHESTDFKVKHLRIRVGRTRRAWVKNCVGIGLSAGFVEPLESTGIFLIQHGIGELIHHFPSKPMAEDLAWNYNRVVRECIEGVRDFLILHYCLSGRTDTPFWRSVKDVPIPESLAERLHLWHRRFPNGSSVPPSYHGFAPYSYAVMLTGLGHPPVESHPAINERDTAPANAMFSALAQRSTILATELPSHGAYLRAMYGVDQSANVRK